MDDRANLNRRLQIGSRGERWVPRMTQNQLDAIQSALFDSVLDIDMGRLGAYVYSGDIDQLNGSERASLAELTRKAKAAALSDDDVKRIWPRKVAVVALDSR